MLYQSIHCSGALQNSDMVKGGFILWHIRFQMHVYPVALVSHSALLVLSVWEMASLRLMRINALIVALAQAHALQAQLSRHNIIEQERFLPLLMRWVSVSLLTYFIWTPVCIKTIITTRQTGGLLCAYKPLLPTSA